MPEIEPTFGGKKITYNNHGSVEYIRTTVGWRVIARHMPTGITAESSEYASFFMNRELALQRLSAKLSKL